MHEGLQVLTLAWEPSACPAEEPDLSDWVSFVRDARGPRQRWHHANILLAFLCITVESLLMCCKEITNLSPSQKYNPISMGTRKDERIMYISSH